MEISAYMFETSSRSYEPSIEDRLYLRWILKAERRVINSFPQRRKNICYLYRYKDLSQMEIADRLNLSIRTIEKHLYLGRREVREHLKKVSCMD